MYFAVGNQTLNSDAIKAAKELLRYMLTARWVDRVELEFINRGEAFFHVGGAGHEGMVAFAPHLKSGDWLHLHYRDKALMLARGLPIEQFFHSLLCSAESHSAGRQMSAHLSAPDLKILSLVGPVGNNALQAVGVAHEIKGSGQDGIVLCASGDGTSQQGEFLEAIAEAVRAELPVLFVVEDNHYAISTHTARRTWYDHPNGAATEFYGIPITRLPGVDVLTCSTQIEELVSEIRRSPGPQLIIFQVERLTNHTNADDERVYRKEDELQQVRAQSDPIEHLISALRSAGVPATQLEELEREVEAEVRSASQRALDAAEPKANLDARPPLAAAALAKVEFTGGVADPQTTMLVALRSVLEHQLRMDRKVTLFGEDIEDPKGDVFGLTRGLSQAFPEQVRNSPLAESTIVGASIGRALAGGRPVGMIQFADFLPIAFNQIASELGSIFWRTVGGWRCPAIIMAPCGGYRPGLGPFHAQSFEGLLTHVPGVDVYLPSNAGDAAGLLQAAFASERPTVFLYPKVFLNDPTRATSPDVSDHFVVPGKARFVARGDNLTIVSWGGTMALCERAGEVLAQVGLPCDVIDLRSLSPWDQDAVCESARRTGRLVVVHEDNLTCGFGAEVLAVVMERTGGKVAARRVTRPDTYVPCNYGNQLQVLPSFERILEACCILLEARLDWEEPAALVADGGTYVCEAFGFSPADQQVTVLEWKVEPGAQVAAGDVIAECDADKAAFDLRAPVSGEIGDLVPVNTPIAVGSQLARIKTPEMGRARRRIPAERKPVIVKNNSPRRVITTSVSSLEKAETVKPVLLSGLSFVTGGRQVANEELLDQFPGRTADDIRQRTGIETRYVCVSGEDALTMAVAAARLTLKKLGLTPADIDGIYVSTSSPLAISPSLACMLQSELSKDSAMKDVPASDILAACSGWLYALQTAFDACQQNPGARMLVVSTEAMSHWLSPNDFETTFLFGDAATAVIVSGTEHAHGAQIRLNRPVLAARGEDGSVLSVGRIEAGRLQPIAMQGRKVFSLAVRQMYEMLIKACGAEGWLPEDLDWVVPHQANGRIISAVQQLSGLPADKFINNIAHYGNTSSCSIPIALAEMIAAGEKGRVGLSAFGSGFTFAAATLEIF